LKDETTGVAAGQRYRQAGNVAALWEVIALARHPGEPVPHVRLSRVGAPKDLKTVSVRVLRDRRFYEPLR
jgi:hypothetical protein